MTEEIDYRAAVAENVTQEYNDFYAAEMQKSKEEIFNDAYQIHFYNELKEFLTSEAESHYLVTDGSAVCIRTVKACWRVCMTTT